MSEGADSLLVERLGLIPEGTEAMLLTLNRPEQMNPLDWDTFRLLEAALHEADADARIRAVLLTGKGRAFSAGGDLKGYQTLQRDPVQFPRFLDHVHGIFTFMRTMTKPVISLVNGVAAAGGLETVLFSDFAYAARSARLGDLHLNFGMMGGGGVLTLLARTIHPGAARELIYSGRLLSAEEARELGIVNKVVEDDQLLAEGVAIANSIAKKSSLAVANAKHVLNNVTSDGSSVDAGLRYERERTIRYCLTAADAQEGLLAFAEKRAPMFIGA
jgi:enoyl-CoA hydratase/carnithine racemase